MITDAKLPQKSLVEALFGPDCVVEAAAPALVDHELFAEEHAHIARSVPKRRAEFGTARVCARRALTRLGVAPVSLVPTDDRAPRWPNGVVGSISHTSNYCAVVVASARAYLSLGLDIEQDKSLEPEMAAMICTAHELSTLATRSPHDAIVYFSAKEAFYKCQYPLTQRLLDFRDVELELDFARGTFQARVLLERRARPAWLDRLRGRFTRGAGLVHCGITLAAP
ncbi:MAG TPA: 4'-phosphopantetheinyl transferase superfamily protein [Polyangiales bacterium]|nr:4'-phosphopantetheinyl transferase superfamily protein [Polyangiales bacterium]